ncbi:5' nucleotidase, NT5C type [Bifidobacterium myosotis]|nr:2-C-methyl-D-erythritol 4-phosphate cytidylyltransferase [Bifidobacterium myosotis]
MRPYTLAVDLDNTLADYTGALRRFARAGYGADLPCPDPAAYDFDLADGWPWSGTGLTFWDVHSAAVARGLYEDMDPMPGARDALMALDRMGVRVLAATSRTDDGDASREWLDRHAMPVAALLHGDKTAVDADLWVDDDPRLLARLAAAGRTALHPAHAYCAGAPGIVFRDWAEAPGIVARLRGL